MECCKNCNTDMITQEVYCKSCGKPLHNECAIKDGGTFSCDVCYTLGCEKSAEEKTTFVVPPIIRRSYIELYKACPFKFYNEVIKGITQPHNIYAQLGIDLHTYFDKACQDRSYLKKQMREDFEKLYVGYDDSIFPTQDLKVKMYARGINSIDTFYSTIEEMPEPFKTEETIQFPIGDGLPIVQTTSDRIDEVNGELEMLDWKTGKVMVGKKLSSDLQTPLYIYGVRHKYQRPIRKFTFHYLDEGKTRVFNRINNDEYVCIVNKREYYINIQDSIREVQAMFNQILKGNFNIPLNTKGMYFTCKNCHLQALEICRGADVESWRQHNGRN